MAREFFNAISEGDNIKQHSIYTSMNFLDSLERSVNLLSSSNEQQYTAAEELFEAGRYLEAAEIYGALGQYKDSAARAAHHHQK